LVWVKTRNNPDLERLFDQLYLTLKAADPDLISFCKTYLPHVTLGRFKSRPHPAFTFTPSLPRDGTATFVADRLALYKSTLGTPHSIYKEIHSIALNS